MVSPRVLDLCELLDVNPYEVSAKTINKNQVEDPFEHLKKEFEKLVKHLHDVNLENVKEETDETDLSGELACTGGSCEITSL